MKKGISLVLALVMCLCLCACSDSGPHPLSIDFQTEEELVTALEAYFSDENWHGLEKEQWNEKVNEVTNVLKNNTSIHHYFHKSDEAVALAHKLCDDSSIGQYLTWLVFGACDTTGWYAGIAEKEDSYYGYSPLFFVSWYYDRPTFSSVADAIRDNFIDPLSVSILSGQWALINPVDGYYSVPLNYVGIVEVRATNRLGGYVTEKFIIKGAIKKDKIELIGKYYGIPNQWTGIDSDFYESYNADDFYPQKMEAENIPMP